MSQAPPKHALDVFEAGDLEGVFSLRRALLQSIFDHYSSSSSSTAPGYITMRQSLRMAEETGILPSMMSSKAWREAFQVSRPGSVSNVQEKAGRRGGGEGLNGVVAAGRGGGEYSCDFEGFLMGLAKASFVAYRQVNPNALHFSP
jgi:hypothetical protein